jgi:signal transduction histidine kinase
MAPPTAAGNDAKRSSRLGLVGWSAIAAAALVYIGVVAAVMWREHERATNLARTDGLNMVRLIEVLLAKSIGEVDTRLTAAAAEAGGDLPVVVTTYVPDLAPPMLHLAVWRPDGEVLLDPDRRAAELKAAMATPLDRLTDGLAVGRPIKDPTHGWLMVLAGERRCGDGPCVAATTLSAEGLSGLLELVRMPGFGTVGVNTRDGTLLLRHPWREDQIGVRFDRSALFTDLLPRAPSGTGTVVFYTLDQSRRLIAYESVRNAPLVVAVTRPWDEILAGWRGNLVIAVLLSLLLVALLPLGLWLVLRAEQARLSAEAARRAAEMGSEQKSQFLALMSHELRTPLNAVMGFSELIRDEAVGPIGNPTYRAYAADIHQAGGFLLAVLNDILDFAKIEAGRMSAAAQKVDCSVLARNVVALVKHALERKSLTLDVAGAEIGRTFHADPRHAQQMVLNLLSNAAKFSAPGGRVRLAFVADADGGMTISVGDDGVGMTADEIETALDRFGQVENPYTRTEQGTGLGLPIVKGLIGLLGGRLTIESAPGVGTTVSLWFPPPPVSA